MKRSLENMNIALVHDWLTNLAGAERVLVELKQILPKADIYTSVFDSDKVQAFKRDEVKTSFFQNLPLVKKHRELLIPFTPFIFEQFDFSKYDLVISNTTFAAKGILTRPGTTHVSYCHTPPRYIWEPGLDPRASSGRFSFLRKNIAHKIRIWDRVAADRVDFFMGNSKYIVNRIKKYYGRDAAVLYPPVNVDFFKDSEREEKDFFLFVGRLTDYKKCDIVIQAFNQIGSNLVVVGGGPQESKLRSMAKRNIKFAGRISDEELRTLYSQAKALIFPSEEDFGIVPLEAMAAGCPVIAYNKGGAAETVDENKTGLFFKEQTPQSLILAIEKLSSAHLEIKYIQAHAEKYSKQNFANNFKETITKFIES